MRSDSDFQASSSDSNDDDAGPAASSSDDDDDDEDEADEAAVPGAFTTAAALLRRPAETPAPDAGAAPPRRQRARTIRVRFPTFCLPCGSPSLIRRHAPGAALRPPPPQKPKYINPILHDVWETLEGKYPVVAATATDPPAALKAALLPFQREGLGWMLQQEAGPFAGGILADEMGMGKTIQMIALLLAAPAHGKPTLVVCPTVALMQWQQEIVRHTEPNALPVTVYYGTHLAGGRTRGTGRGRWGVGPRDRAWTTGVGTRDRAWTTGRWDEGQGVDEGGLGRGTGLEGYSYVRLHP